MFNSPEIISPFLCIFPVFVMFTLLFYGVVPLISSMNLLFFLSFFITNPTFSPKYQRL